MQNAERKIEVIRELQIGLAGVDPPSLKPWRAGIPFPSRRRLTLSALPMPMFTMGLYHLHRNCQRKSEVMVRFRVVSVRKPAENSEPQTETLPSTIVRKKAASQYVPSN